MLATSATVKSPLLQLLLELGRDSGEHQQDRPFTLVEWKPFNRLGLDPKLLCGCE